jgi:hypothetical protein
MVESLGAQSMMGWSVGRLVRRRRVSCLNSPYMDVALPPSWFAAGIQETTMSPTRASPRLAGVPDQHVMEKAKKRAAWKNLDNGGNDTLTR